MRLIAVAAALSTLLIGLLDRQSESNSCGRFPEAGFDAPEMSSFVGRYSNPNYLYSVRIPDGLVGYSSPPPAPHHGFGVALSREDRGYFWINSASNAVDWANEREVLAAYLKSVGADAEKLTSVHQRGARLGRQPARELTVRYRCPGSPIERVEVDIVSLQRGLVDEAGLLTTSARFQRDYRVFMATVGTWHITGKY